MSTPISTSVRRRGSLSSSPATPVSVTGRMDSRILRAIPRDLRIAAFDPGETTGVAVVSRIGKPLCNETFWMWEGVKDILETYNPHVVVIESFQLYPWKSKEQGFSTFPPVEVIGVIKYLCVMRGTPFVTQMPTLKKFFTDARLKSYKAHHSVIHARDAMRHALYYVVFTSKTAKALR